MSVSAAAHPLASDPVLERIQAALHGLRYGAVEITVHNGQVVVIERREKFRLSDTRPPR